MMAAQLKYLNPERNVKIKFTSKIWKNPSYDIALLSLITDVSKGKVEHASPNILSGNSVPKAQFISLTSCDVILSIRDFIIY